MLRARRRAGICVGDRAVNRRRFLLSALAAPVATGAALTANPSIVAAQTRYAEALRELLDSQVFASFPGFLYAERMPMPYRPLDGAFVQFVKALEASARKIGDAA